jgi:methylated-DNA-[protein]-cysteine S-methyltransferase
MDRTVHHYSIFATASGHVAIAWNMTGISSLRLPASSAEAAERSLLRRLPGAVRAEPPAEVAEVIGATRRYFDGEETDFSEVRVDLGEQEPLFARIYAVVRKLGWGQTTTYGTVAKDLGLGPEVARDVGRAMAMNPLPLIIPCHRVLAAGGKVGGFSAPGGADSKARMLAMEGFVMAQPETAQQGFAF